MPSQFLNRLLHLLMTLTLVGLGGLAYPFGGPTSSWILVSLIVLFNGWLWWTPSGWPQRFRHRLTTITALRNAILVTLPVVIVFGWIEAFYQTATHNGWLPYYSPMVTMLPEGQEDWRLAHITADEFREPDPVLLWRPVASRPYNSHRFKGPEPMTPKSADTFRIMTYGDSNTDGPDVDAWPDRLQRALNSAQGSSGRRHFEVLNAGVTGYSSYQGLRRYEAEVERYDPDLVIVSFGWNDAAPANGVPDRSFEPPPPIAVFLLRTVVLRYRSFLVARYVLEQFKRNNGMTHTPSQPRVSVESYSRNLRRFIEISRSRDTHIVLLTRPHRTAAAGLGPDAAWRLAVPSYNAELLLTAAASEVHAVDVWRLFNELYPELFADEAHFTLEGHATFGRFLAGELMRRGIVDSVGPDDIAPT